ncbi:helix-turn-helix transcriptional regulator, partial [Escherichia coli]|nr:helix-turn-helix transcriptional regulator [Escherichia coli]
KYVFHFDAESTDQTLFAKLFWDLPKNEKIAIIFYFILKMKDTALIYSCISRSINTSFSESVRCIFEKDISNQWSAQLIARELNVTAQTIRNKLYSEGYKFNDLLLDVRMRHALRLLLTTDLHVNTLAYKLGFSSTSYFISLFKKYYGVTPKQLAVQLRKS